MDNFIYDRLGNPVAFIDGNFIHTLLGQTIGQIRDTHIHKISGEYVGELYDNMVVDMNIGDLGNIGHGGHPGNPGFRGIPKNRGAVELKYVEVFHKLLDRINYADESINKFGYKVI